jgi:two-component system, cell cycle sensor histidine kinase and response regulator CckA
VLLMEDAEEMLQTMGTLLERLDCNVTKVREGAAAIVAFREAREKGDPFDVVILDQTVVAGMGGIEALKGLRRIDGSIRAVLCSGYTSDLVLSEIYDELTVVLPKPFSYEDLKRVLRVLLGITPLPSKL